MNTQTRAALGVAWKDIKIFLKDRGQLIYLFVVPLIFILAIGSAVGGQSEPQEQRITLPVVNLDAGSAASQALIDALNAAGGIQVKLYDAAEARSLLDAGEIVRVLTIPAQYGADVADGNPVTLRLVSDADASDAASEAVQRIVAGVATDLSLETQLIRSFEQMAAMQASMPPEQQAFTADVVVAQAQSQFERARSAPLVGVEELWPEHLLQEDEEFEAALMVVPGFTILFAFLAAQATAQSIYNEKKIGSFRRLLAAPISKATVLVGKMAPNFLTVLVQFVVIFCASLLLSPVLGLELLTLGNDPLALILVCLVIALCSTSLGVLISGIARTESQISGVGTVVLWVMAFASFLPNFLLPPFLRTLQQLLPHYWGVEAFDQLMVRGGGLADITTSLAVLLGITLVFFVVGLWRFEYDR